MLYITSIVRVDQKEQQLAVEGYYRTQWLGDYCPVWHDTTVPKMVMERDTTVTVTTRIITLQGR